MSPEVPVNGLRRLNEASAATSVFPSSMTSIILTSVQFLDYKNSPFFSQIGMQVDLRPMETAGRLLQPPDIQYQGSIVDLSVQAEKVNWDRTNALPQNLNRRVANRVSRNMECRETAVLPTCSPQPMDRGFVCSAEFVSIRR